MASGADVGALAGSVSSNMVVSKARGLARHCTLVHDAGLCAGVCACLSACMRSFVHVCLCVRMNLAVSRGAVASGAIDACVVWR